MAGDFIPHRDGTFLEWAKNLLTYVNTKLAAFNIPAGATAEIQPLLTAYDTAFQAAQNPNRGKIDVLTKNEAKEALISVLRTFIKAYLMYNPAVTDADKESMGLPVHDTTRTPTPVPSTIPELELDSSIIRQVSVHYRDAGNEKRSKPHGVHGIELRWALLENPPASVEDLKNSVFDTASPYTFVFDEVERGNALYICPRWENNKGEKGPLGEIVKAIIP
jgi:hypothetical protein